MATIFKPFGCNPHQHSDASLDGGSSVEKIVKRAKELEYGHLVLTEHGNFNSAAQLAMHAKKANIPFSHGIEVYLDPPFTINSSIIQLDDSRSLEQKLADMMSEEAVSTDKRSYMHLTVLFKTTKAYEYFCRLTPVMESRAVTRFGERKPIISWSELEEIGADLVIGTGCLVGFTQKFVMQGRPDLAERAYQMLRSIVKPGCLFLEIFPHCVSHEWQRPKLDDTGRIIESGKFIENECLPGQSHNDIQRGPNEFIVTMGAKYKDPIVVSQDSHFAYSSQKAVQDARLGNGKENWRFYTSYHMRTPMECFQELQKMNITTYQMESFVDNSYRLKDELSGYKFLTKEDRWILPTFEGGDTITHLIGLIKKHGRMPKNNPEYTQRLKREITVLARNRKGLDFLPYIFEVEQVSSWCKDNDVLMNLRGSAGGSLIAYLISASITDPIRYNLPFERFITDDRIDSGNIPDMDSDFSSKAKVMKYLHEYYGDRIVQLSININLKLKNSIKDSERTILGRVRPETEIMCIKFPGIPQGITETDWLFGYRDPDTGVNTEGFLETNDELIAYSKANPEVWAMVSECLGVMRNKSSHPCGALITPLAASNYFPLTWVGTKKDGQLCTGFDPKSLEYAGGIKFDWLGVKTLEVVRIASNLIKKRRDIHLPWEEYPHDESVYEEIFHKGDTAGVFQFYSNTIIPLLKATKPRSTSELSALTALGRPGTLDAPAPDGSDRTCAQYFVAIANGEKPFLIHPDLEPIIKETNYVFLYQEQLLHTFNYLGGYSLQRAELVRRSVSKKDKTELNGHLANLKVALLARGTGWTPKQVDLCCEQLLASNRYSFNKAHAMSYAIVGYNTAYLKKNYYLEFMAAELTVFGHVEEKLKLYTATLGSTILQPSISKSHAEEWVIEDDKIRAPLSVIHGCGDKAAAGITESAPYTSIKDFALRCSGRSVNRGIFTKLVLAGLFDEFNMSTDEMLQSYWSTKKIKDPIPPQFLNMTPIVKFVNRVQHNSLATEKLIDIVRSVLISKQWTPTNNLSCPFILASRGIVMMADVASATKYLTNPYVVTMQKDVYMVGLFLGSKVETTKTGKRLLKVQLSDGTTEFEAINWNVLTALKYPKNTIVILSGKLKRGYKVPISISMGNIQPL